MSGPSRPFTAILYDLQNRLRDEKPAEYQDMINLGLGNPGTPVDSGLLDTVDSDIKARGGFAGYGSSTGQLSTRKVVGDFVKNHRGTNYAFDDQYSQVAITAGVTETIREYFSAMYNKGAVRKNGHMQHPILKVLIPTPAYAWHLDSLKHAAAGIETVKIDTSRHDWKLGITALSSALQKTPDAAAIILNYPCNPTGKDLSEMEWKSVATVLKHHIKEHPNFRIVLDNAYKDLSFDRHAGLLEVAPELMPNTIEFNSVAKFHGYAGRKGPGFAISANPDDISMLRSRLNSNLGIGPDKEAFLRKAFSEEYFTPERIEKTIGMYRRRCSFVANYITQQLASTKGQNHHIALSADGGMFVFADFSKWLDKKIDHEEAREFRKLLVKTMPEEADFFNHEVFENNKINDDKDLAIYLILKAHVVTLPGQDFETNKKAGMLRIALGDIGEMTTYNQPNDGFFDKELVPNREDLNEKPLNDLRMLKAGMDKVIETLQLLAQERKISS